MLDQLQQVASTEVLWDGRRWTYFGGCDYLRLSWHPEVRSAVASAVAKFGLNVAASRLTTGNHPLYNQLEAALADFFDRDRALVVSTGYNANLMSAQALAGEFTHVFLDAHAHPSLVDAAALLHPASVARFAYRDVADLTKLVRQLPRFSKALLMTDGVFTHDGSCAPLAEYRATLPRNAWLWVDDCHGAGTVGPRGQGAPALCGISSERLIHICTLSKAFGCYGGVILGTKSLLARIEVASQMFIGSTPPPLPYMAGALASLDIIKHEPNRVARLKANVHYTRDKLFGSGEADSQFPGPSVGVVPLRASEREAIRERLLGNRIYPCFVRYPGGPKAGYFRFSLSSEHSEEELSRLISALQRGGKEGTSDTRAVP
jgi:7-keto-8-aminopelargonate synthetase-like enzyme